MSDCVKFQGKPGHYQNEAAERYMYVWLTPIGQLAVVTLDCDTPHCLNTEHMVIRTPKRLAYPKGVCTYCGMPGRTKDHLMPVTWTGEAVRRGVLTVPACGECNSAIGDTYAPTIKERRDIAQAHLRRRYKRVLARVTYTAEELAEFEGMLLVAVLEGLEEKQIVLERLAWPDNGYDARAIEGSDLDASTAALLLAGQN